MHRHLTLKLGTLVFLSLAPVVAPASEVTLELRGPTPPLAGDLVVRGEGGSGSETTYPLQDSVRLPTPVGATSVSCRGTGLWCPTIPLDNDEVKLPVFATITMSARLSGLSAVEELHGGTVQGVVHRDKDGPPLDFRAPLSFEDGRVSFAAPRALIDLRFAFPGAAPVYRWGIQPPTKNPAPEDLDLGNLSLHPGGSVSGWAKSEATELPVPSAHVEVSEVTGGDSPPPFLASEVKTEKNGFFQIPSLDSGTYRLKVSAPGLVAQVLESVEVQSGSETLLGTVLLHQPIRLSVEVRPPQDPKGQPWSLSVRPLQPLPEEKPIEVTANEQGIAEISALRAAEYVVQVSSSDGDMFLLDQHRVTGDGWLRLDVPLAKVEGTVRLGDEPIEARVELESGSGDRSELRSNEDGELSGWIRRPERAWLLATVNWDEGDEKRRRKLNLTPDVSGEVIHLDIELPAGAVFGEVVNQLGEPQPDLRVVASPAAGSSQFSEIVGQTDRSGRFHLTGLDATEYLLQAGGDGQPASEVVRVDLSNHLPVGEVRLVVWPTRRLEGQVSRGGQGVAGARVALAGVGRVPVSFEVPTDGQGRFRLELPESVERAVVTVFAPSQLLWSSCLAISGDDLVVSLPDPPSASLSLSTTGRVDLPPVTGGQEVLLTGDGGIVSYGGVVNWSRLRGAQRAIEPSGSSVVDHLQVPGIAAGRYALAWSTEPLWALAAKTCAGAFPNATWVAVDPGGEADLELDLGAIQERAAKEKEPASSD